MVRALWILVTPLAIALSLWLLTSKLITPRIEAWALSTLQSYSDSSLPVSLRAEKIQIRFLKPSLSLENIVLTAKGDHAYALKDLRIKNVRVFVDFLHLLSGRITISAVVIDSPEANINLDPFLKDDSPPQEIPIELIFAQAEKWPLERVFFKNINLKLSSDELKFNALASGADLLFTNMGKNLTAKANIPALKIDLKNYGDLQGSLDTHLYLSRQSLRIIQLGVHLDESEVLARGELTNISRVLIQPTGVVDLSARFNLSDLYKELKRVRPKSKIPNIAGELNMDIETRFDGLQDLRGQADIKTRGLMIEKFELGDARIQGDYKNRMITLSEMKVFHPAGEAALTDSQIFLGGNYSFKSKVGVTSLDLQKLFQTLDLAHIPVGMGLKGVLPCDGQVYPTFHITCTQAKISAQDIWVKADNIEKAPYILNVSQMGAQGQVRVTADSVTYAANVSLGTSNGSSDGVIDFSHGFKIAFKTNKLDFANVENLANLKMQGSAAIEGSTSGDSSYAVFNMNLKARDFIFEEFSLGNLVSDLKYRRGHLMFSNIAGAIKKTNYLGELDVNLVENKLEGDFRLPSAELSDIASVFDRIYKLPVTVQGTGAAKAHVSGPLNFWKLNYEVDSAFKKVAVGYESFELLNFNVSAQNGNIKANKVLLKKGNSTVTLLGGISSDQIMDLYADGKSWKLEESDFLSGNNMNSSIIGNLNFAAEFKDSIQNPNILIKGAITDTLFEEQEIPNSNFILRMDRNSLGAQVSLFGDRVQGEVQLPLEKGRAPLQIKLKTNNWNFSSLLGLVGGAALANEYTSSLTANVDLRSEAGDIFKTTGKMNIQTLSLKRGNLSFVNSAPIDITTDNGITSIRNFQLEGPNNSLQIRGTNFTADNLNVAVNLHADLRLLQILTPFLEDLGGGVDLSATLSGSVKKPEILGTLQNRNAFVKIKGFPHPLERLSSDVVFSQSKILINSIKGQMAGGTLTGDGGIMINGIRDLPASIRLRLDNVTFNVPDKVRSSGNADLILSGRWFPFTLSGSYHVSSGLVEKEFTEDSGGITGVRQSLYLPKVIREGHFEPLLLDLQIILDRNIQVKNSLLDGSVNGHLQVKGAPTSPLLFGKINIDKKAKLIFKDKIFEVQNGLIEFNDPDEINPNLYISGLSRINDYDITLLAQGPSKSLTIRLSSVPPLPEQDIISLIALGVTSSNMDQNLQSRQQAEQLGVEIGGAVLAKPISKQLESTLGLNLQVTSEYDSTRNISVPKVTLSRRLSERVKVSGSRPVKDTQSYDIKLEYLINSNITAVGSFESRGVEDNTTLQSTQPASQSIFGLDLEFKREFK